MPLCRKVVDVDRAVGILHAQMYAFSHSILRNEPCLCTETCLCVHVCIVHMHTYMCVHISWHRYDHTTSSWQKTYWPVTQLIRLCPVTTLDDAWLDSILIEQQCKRRKPQGIHQSASMLGHETFNAAKPLKHEYLLTPAKQIRLQTVSIYVLTCVALHRTSSTTQIINQTW